MNTKAVSYRDENTSLTGFLVRDDADGNRRPGILVVHGGAGLDEHAKRRPAEPGRMKAKVLVCHGALDPHVLTTDVTAFAEEMNAAGADWQLIVYGCATHGFTHEDADGSKIPGVAYNALADARSAAALRQFFAEIFGLHN